MAYMSCITSNWVVENPYKKLFDRGILRYVGYSSNETLNIVFTAKEKAYYITLAHHSPDNTYEDTGRPQLLASCGDCELIRVFEAQNLLLFIWSNHSIQWFGSVSNPNKRKWALLYQFTSKDYSALTNGQKILGLHIFPYNMKLVYMTTGVGDSQTASSKETSPHEVQNSVCLHCVDMYENESDRTMCLSPPLIVAHIGDKLVVDTLATGHILFILLKKLEADESTDSGDFYVYAYNLKTGRTLMLALPQSSQPSLPTTQPQFMSVTQSESIPQNSCFLHIGTTQILYRISWPPFSTSAALIFHSYSLPPHLATTSNVSVLAYAEASTFMACLHEENMYIMKFAHLDSSQSNPVVLTVPLPVAKPCHRSPCPRFLHATHATAHSPLPLLYGTAGYAMSIEGCGGGDMYSFLDSLLFSHVQKHSHYIHCEPRTPPTADAASVPDICAPRGRTRRKKGFAEGESEFPPLPKRPSVYETYSQLIAQHLAQHTSAPPLPPALTPTASSSLSFDFLSALHPITLLPRINAAEGGVLWCYHVLGAIDSLDLMDIVTYMLQPPVNPIPPTMLDELAPISPSPPLLTLILSYFISFGEYTVPRALSALLGHLRHVQEDWEEKYRKLEVWQDDGVGADKGDGGEVKQQEEGFRFEGAVFDAEEGGGLSSSNGVCLLERFSWLQALIQQSYRGRALHPPVSHFQHHTSSPSSARRDETPRGHGQQEASRWWGEGGRGTEDFPEESEDDAADQTTTVLLTNRFNQELTDAVCIAAHRYLMRQHAPNKENSIAISLPHPSTHEQFMSVDSCSQEDLHDCLSELIKLLLVCKQFILVAHLLIVTHHHHELCEYTRRDQDDEEGNYGEVEEKELDTYNYIPPMPLQCIQNSVRKYGESSEEDRRTEAGIENNAYDTNEGSMVMGRMQVAKEIFSMALSHLLQSRIHNPSSSDDNHISRLLQKKPICMSEDDVMVIVAKVFEAAGDADVDFSLEWVRRMLL